MAESEKTSLKYAYDVFIHKYKIMESCPAYGDDPAHNKAVAALN